MKAKSYERSANFISEHDSAVASAISREGGDGGSHPCRIRDLYDLRGCVSLLFGEESHGPTPREVLEPPIFYTICLLSSSLTIHFAAKSLQRDHRRLFLGFWLLTIALGGSFLYGTAQEWHRLIYDHGLTISTNLFGTTYYSLVGLHAFHVTAGLAMLLTVAVLGLCARVGVSRSGHIEVLSMYWHFVDAVWVVVFSVVYVLGC